METRISWMALVALAALLYVLFAGLANPRTRPFIIGMGTLVGIVVFLFFVSARRAVVHVEERNRQAQEQMAQARARMLPSPPAPAPSRSSARETRRPKMTMIAALRQAVVQGLKGRPIVPTAEAPVAAAPTAEAPDSEYRVPQPAKTDQADLPAKRQPPDWLNAAPKMEDNSYTMSVRVGPFTTPLECERELPKAIQGAVTEYAELSLDPQAAAVRLPEDELKQLVRDRWTEVRPMEIDGGSQEMVSLYAKVVFDVPVQQRIKSEAQRLVIARRVQGAAVVFGGVLGFLALAWSGLKLATRI